MFAADVPATRGHSTIAQPSAGPIFSPISDDHHPANPARRKHASSLLHAGGMHNRPRDCDRMLQKWRRLRFASHLGARENDDYGFCGSLWVGDRVYITRAMRLKVQRGIWDRDRCLRLLSDINHCCTVTSYRWWRPSSPLSSRRARPASPS